MICGPVVLSRQPVVLATHPSLGIKTLAELITFAKRRPGQSYANDAATGSQQHIVAEWFARLAEIKLEQVPYRGGGPVINDLIGGHVKIGWLGSSSLIPHFKAGTLRLLAQSTAVRSSNLPDVPTYGEGGFKALVLDQWLGVFTPAGTPSAIVARPTRWAGQSRLGCGIAAADGGKDIFTDCLNLSGRSCVYRTGGP